MLRSLKHHLDLGGDRAKPHRLKSKPEVEALESRWTPSGSTISGTVFADANNSGILVAGEQGIPNNTLQLKNTGGQVLATTTTDANGNYSFSQDNTVNTQPTTKEVDATFGPNVTNWSATQTVAQFDPSLGQLTGVDIISNAALTSVIKVQSLDSASSHVTGHVSGEVTLTVGNNVKPLVTDIATDEATDLPAYDNAAFFTGNATHDFGPKTATSSNSVSLDAGSTDLSQFEGTGQVTLTEGAVATSSADGAGNLLSEINSTATGQVQIVYHYTPSNSLKPGQYVVYEPQTPPGYLDGKNTADNIHPLPPVPKNTIPVTLDATNNSTTNNFGKLKPASLAGYVYVDNGNTGIRTSSDAGIGNVTINLTGTDDQGNAVSQSTVTAADGSYLFATLRPGNYTLNEPQQPAGYLDGKTTIGSQGGTQGVDTLSNINLAQGTNGTENNFGKLVPTPAPTPKPTPAPVVDALQSAQPLSKREFTGNAWMAWAW